MKVPYFKLSREHHADLEVCFRDPPCRIGKSLLPEKAGVSEHITG